MNWPLRLQLPQRRLLRLIMLGVLWAVSLSVALVLAKQSFDFRTDQIRDSAGRWFRQTVWAWPLAATGTFAVLTSHRARQRWPQRSRRVRLGLAVATGLILLIGLPIAIGLNKALLILGAVVLVGSLAAWSIVAPRRLAPPVPAAALDGMTESRRLEATNARIKLQNDLRTTALQAIGGMAVLAGAVLGFQQFTEDRRQARATQDLTRQGQASERFTVAIGQLDSTHREVQLGGIYGLEQVAQQAPANRLTVTEVLAAYLHRRVPRPATPSPTTATSVEELRIRTPDAQAALTVLGRREVAPGDPPLNLRALDLRRSDLGGADLRGADLAGADLRWADLRDAKLGAADLIGADLTDADLGNATLTGADLSDATLVDAYLRDAKLGNATLRGADLYSADLTDAHLAAADLRDAKLSDATLFLAELFRADLSGADLSGTDLSGATLQGVTAKETTWPDGFDPQGAGVRREDSSTRP